MTKVISISTDRNIFVTGSTVQKRQTEYGQLFDELHVVVFSKGFMGLPRKIELAPNVWAYGTSSISKLFYMSDAKRLAHKIITSRALLSKDVVVSTQDPFETGLVGLSLKKKFKISLHVQIHTDFLSPYFIGESLINRGRAMFASRVLRHADAVRVVSKRIASSLSRVALKTGVVPVVLPIYVDIEKFESAPVTVDLKKKYPQFNFIVLIASRLTREKNISLGIMAFSKLLGLNTRTGLVVVGSGPEERKLKSLVKKLKIDKSVVFEPWQNDLISYYKTANLFLVTSNYEGYGMTIVEAIASHCPVVSTDVGIAKEILQDGISFVCPVGDENCFVDLTLKLIADNALRERFGFEARGRLGEVTFSLKKDYLDAYKKSIDAASY